MTDLTGITLTNIDVVMGEVVVIRGKAPTTPRTFKGDSVMESGAQVCYWSITTNEFSPTNNVVDGAFDEQLPLDENGYYTLVVSLPVNRPQNAHEKFGVKWMDCGGGKGRRSREL